MGDIDGQSNISARDRALHGCEIPDDAEGTAMSDMIVVQDLVKNYGDFCAVNHISFAVPEGKIFGFLGPNGAGKTTTIKMLTTVLHPTSGSLRVNGHDPERE